MNKLLFVTSLALAANLSWAGSSTSGFDTYRHAVLGDSTLGSAANSRLVPDEDLRVLGPYGRYLMYLGVSKNDAAAQAKLTGERSSLGVARAPRQALTGYALYERAVLGRTDTGIERRLVSASSPSDVIDASAR